MIANPQIMTENEVSLIAPRKEGLRDGETADFKWLEMKQRRIYRKEIEHSN